MKVVIAEKPSVAMDLARVLGANKRNDGYLEGNGYAVTWALGHLVTLASPEAYGFSTQWTATELPMLPDQFQLIVRQVKGKGKELKPDAGAVKQLSIIKGLLDRSDSLIVATDAGREGELIFRYIYEYLSCQKPFQRLWISSQTDQAIRQGFANLKDGREYDSLYWQAKSRSEADWLVGLNATRALSIASRTFFSVGRVQTPSLAMICRRYLENKSFKPETFFQIEVELSKEAASFKALSEVKYKQKEEAQKAFHRAQAATSATVVSVEENNKTEAPPLLHDLTSLQQEANKKLSLSAEKTLQIAQKLYEAKLITYPRTGSKYISEDVFVKIPELMANAKLGNFSQVARNLMAIPVEKLTRRSVNDAKVTDHHALLPTENLPQDLSKEEQAVYDLVVGRMLEAFHRPCQKKITDVVLKIAGDVYLTKGVVILEMGWREVFGSATEDEEQENKALPWLKINERLALTLAKLLEKQTQPKPLYTEATLLKAMETCGKDIEDEALREAMKDSGLGTPATRAQIIERLFQVNYLERKGKSLVPTQKGLALHEVVKDKLIGQAELTGKWEKLLEEIREKRVPMEQFMGGIYNFTRKITEEFMLRGANYQAPEKKSFLCPKCQKGTIRESAKSFYCTEYKTDCDFTVWKEIAGKKITGSMVKELIEQGKTKKLKGFTSKANKPFDAVLILDDSKKVVFHFQ